jgi:hypothetical protein
MAIKIGPTFVNELQAAGLLGLPFSWGGDGVIQFAPSMLKAQIDAVNAVYAAHDPTKPPVIVPSAAAVALAAVVSDVTISPKLKAVLTALIVS